MQVHGPEVQALVAGAGPAGMLLAAACAQAGLRVLVLDPDPARAWVNQYGGWASDFQALGLQDALAARWPQAVVHLDQGRQALLDEPYATLDNLRLQTLLRARIEAQGGVLLQGSVARWEDLGAHVRVCLTDGRTFEAPVFIQAQGAPSRPDGPPECQLAYGVLAELTQDPFDADVAVWMDWRAPSQGWDDALARPSFLYALPMPHGRVFLEETFLNHALSSQDPSGDEALALLERRLWRRLAQRGLKVAKVHHVERCRIPMDVPPPAPSRALAFGASAGMVHPATGFMVSAAAAAAPKVAQALSRALPEGGPAATAAAWEALWPQAQRQTWELYRFGAKALLDMDTPQVQAFFHAFFQLPPAQRRAYLSRSQTPKQLAQTMWDTFWRCPWGLRWKLQRAALLDPRPVVRGCFGVGLPKTSL